MNIFSRGLRIVFVIVIGASLAGAGAVRAAPQDVTLTVTTLGEELGGDGFCSLREAMKAANENNPVDACPGGESIGMDTIVFSVSDTIVLSSALPPVGNNGPLTIDGGSAVSVSGNNATNIFVVESGANLTLRNLNVTQGYYPVDPVGGGGGLRNEGGTVTINNCTFLENTANGDANYYGVGGAIFNHTGSVTINNSTFQDNTALGSMGYGGAIYNEADLYISSSTFSANSADYSGGAIGTFVYASISGSTFLDNVAYYGGAIASGGMSSILEVSNSTFDSNMVWEWGGAIYCNPGSCTVNSSSFEGNVAMSGGGAILFVYGDVVSLDGNWFSENSTLGYGGAVHIGASPLFSISNTTFYSNTAAMTGGGLSLWNAKGSISDSLFRLNYAESGGGIYHGADHTFGYSGVTLERTTMWENNSLSGGAVYNYSVYAHTMMTNDTLASNTAGIGGGVYNTSGGLVEILNSTLAHNSAGQSDQLFNDSGSAIYTANSIYAYGGNGYNCLGTITDSGNNIDDSNTCAFTASGSLSNTDPLLGPLQDNDLPDRSPGYPTLTFALHYSSPAISAANASLCPSTDQRQYLRRSGYCDIGSYEAQPYVFYITSGDWQTTDINTYFPEPLVIEAQDTYGNRLAGVPVTFYGPDSGASLANNYTELLTGADGFASFDALANSLPGGWYEVDALHSLGSTFTTFHLINLAPPGSPIWFFLPLLQK